MTSELSLYNRVNITGQIQFETAFHLGSGQEGETDSDMGVLLDPYGEPLIPGSSLKGLFRTTVERLVEHLGQSTCFLEKDATCPGGGNQDASKEALKRLSKANTAQSIEQILTELCDTCRLFGSSLAKGKLFFADASCTEWAKSVEHRDGVVIDRDSGTAVDGAKYDYDVIPKGATFSFELLGENIKLSERHMIHLALLEWERGFRVGGMTSRGLGSAKLTDIQYHYVDLTKPTERVDYLLDGTMPAYSLSDLKAELRTYLTSQAEGQS